jgi:hypothetical protein
MRLSSPTGTTEDVMTEVFLPEFHFPRDGCEVEVSGGKWSLSSESVDEDKTIQVLRWWHGEGEQWMKVKGVPGSRQAVGGGDEVGYLEQCAGGGGQRCAVM